MKRFTLWCLLPVALILCPASMIADDDNTTKNNAVAQLEDDIKYHDEVMEDSRDSIAALDEQIALLKGRIDSLDKVSKDIKNQIEMLEKNKKSFQKDIKTAQKARQETFATRDNMVYENQVLEVLMNPYDKLDVEAALRQAEGMETKEVLNKMELVRDYGKYTKELRDFMDKQRNTFAKLNWSTQGIDSEASKNFHKALKKVSYYKVYEKGLKNVKNASIPYLDKVIEEILLLERQGFNSKYQYDKVVNLLYGAE